MIKITSEDKKIIDEEYNLLTSVQKDTIVKKERKRKFIVCLITTIFFSTANGFLIYYLININDDFKILYLLLIIVIFLIILIFIFMFIKALFSSNETLIKESIKWGIIKNRLSPKQVKENIKTEKKVPLKSVSPNKYIISIEISFFSNINFDYKNKIVFLKKSKKQINICSFKNIIGHDIVENNSTSVLSVLTGVKLGEHLTNNKIIGGLIGTSLTENLNDCCDNIDLIIYLDNSKDVAINLLSSKIKKDGMIYNNTIDLINRICSELDYIENHNKK